MTAIIGPSGCGKSTFLRCLNRMNDLIPGARVEGDVLLDGDDIYAPASTRGAAPPRRHGVPEVRTRFRKSIFDNVAYGLRVQRLRATRTHCAERRRASLRSAALWDEVKDRLDDVGARASPAASSSGSASRARWPSSPRCC